jgi:hypothetical protein
MTRVDSHNETPRHIADARCARTRHVFQRLGPQNVEGLYWACSKKKRRQALTSCMHSVEFADIFPERFVGLRESERGDQANKTHIKFVVCGHWTCSKHTQVQRRIYLQNE